MVFDINEIWSSFGITIKHTKNVVTKFGTAILTNPFPYMGMMAIKP